MEFIFLAQRKEFFAKFAGFEKIFEISQLHEYLVDDDNHANINKVGDLSGGWPEGSLFNSYNTEV